MNWGTMRGNYKKAKLKDLDTICKYHQEGNKYIIDEIFATKLVRTDGRSIYQDDIGKLLVHECSISKNKTEFSIELSIDTLLLKLSMINDNFSACGNNLNQTSRYFKITIDDLKKYYFKTRNANKKRLESGLDKLQRASYIKWEKITKINYNGVYRTATNEEIRIIITAERATMTEMGVADKHELYLKNKFKEYNTSVFEKIKNQINISYYFSVYKVIPSVQFETALLEIGDKDDIEVQLNTNICNAIENLDNGSDDIKKFISICINRDCKVDLYDEVKLLSDQPYTRRDKIIDSVMESEGIDYELAKFLVEPLQ
jgi:hypothetical protein